MEQKLRDRIEKMTGRVMKTPRDFDWLSRQVEERTGQRVSGSTLRRFWGIVSEGVKASAFTKDTLAQYLGYQDFGQFADMQGNEGVQSQLVLGDKVESDSLYEGQMLKLSWLPDRICIVRYEGKARFSVVESSHTRLSAGDTFECHLFINHEPAYLNNWTHAGSEPMTYAIGKKNGVVIERYLSD